MIVSIIGLGLIGGSIALDIKQTGFAKTIIGVDDCTEHLSQAKELNIIDKICSLEEAVQRSQLIILAVPTDMIIKLLPVILDKIVRTEKVVMDVGSTKYIISEFVDNHPSRKNYVATHPLAGTEYSGPKSAIRNLLQNKYVIICDAEKSNSNAFYTVKKMFENIGMKLVFMNSAEHDIHLAYVSHISHIISFALSLTVIEKEREEKNIFLLAGSGFESTVRLAKSANSTWVPIFEQNASGILEVMDTYIEKLQLFKEAIQNKDSLLLSKLIKQANKIQEILK